MPDQTRGSSAEATPNEVTLRDASNSETLLLALQQSGYLPPGVHDLSLAEVHEHFGTFQSSDQRPRLFKKLDQFLDLARAAGIVRFVIVDGSFISAKPIPGDIDIIVVVEPKAMEAKSWRPDQYNVISSRRIRGTYSFDAIVVPEGSQAYQNILEYFSRIKDNGDTRKGVARVML